MEISRWGGTYRIPVTLLVLTVLFSGCSMQNSGTKLDAAGKDQNRKAESNLLQRNTSQEKGTLKVDYLTPLASIQSPEIYVYKEKRRLYVIQSNVLVRDYPIALGLTPQGDKEKDGDGRTPEGEFKICTRDPAGRFGKSLVLNYPDKKHLERAFFAGILSPSEFREILATNGSKEQPLKSNVLGDQISIHAGGAHQDWTNGCIALYASDMEELFKVAGIGTHVSIRP
jgi:hypothetical protein